MIDVMASRPDGELAGVVRAHERAAAVVAGLDQAAARGPSLLPGWSVGHVVTHIARNADGLRNIVEGAAAGEVWPMYPGGMDQRTADIEAGAARPPAALAADVLAAGAALEAAWAGLGDDVWATGRGTGPAGERPVRDLPFVRWREVEIHLVDLGLPAYGVDDWDAGYVVLELARQEAGYRARHGVAELPAGARALAPARRVAWLVGRLAVPGLGDAGPWS